ncbi:hypothetical protein MTQ01_04010 [Streptomyces sp. XM4193]|uniref:hypothetical protein n=1 Tax=Streptomyces sp. XM4193 TaxID=2929782 RepID=UPI001FFAAF9B|nr:hypothetical protein [Streptomyces sp. XM4193]MCK1795186.1 hypothetical protein [Streptomyces sp. XM4193]
MAVAQLIRELPADTHPKAAPGFGKRAVPGQHRDADPHFGHLPPREASIATYLDRLPEGADISVKTLARTTPYGQCALRTALRLISEAGHLRRTRETVLGTDGSYHHITRTHFSRTPRPDTWWEAYTRGEHPTEVAENDRRTPSREHRLLARLGRRDIRLTLSAAECTALEPLLRQWYERGASDADLEHALTAGLPSTVHHPAALVRRRLHDKLPPHAPAPDPTGPLMECTLCQKPGRPHALPGGLCRTCRGEPTPPPRINTEHHRAQVQRVREAAGFTPRPHARVRRA